MPRDGSGHSHNAEEAGENLTHGAPTGNEKTNSEVDRSNKAAPPPEEEAGEGLKNADGSAVASGQGNVVEVDKPKN